jgi:hypothetical protein
MDTTTIRAYQAAAAATGRGEEIAAIKAHQKQDESTHQGEAGKLFQEQE